MASGGRGTKQPQRDKAGFYDSKYGKLISVTTVLKIIPKPALVHWSAIQVANAAIENSPGIAKMRTKAARDEMWTLLRNAAETKRDSAASLGTAFHDAIEAEILGKPAPEVDEAIEPFMEAARRFHREWVIDVESTELVVANPEDGWAGTLDLIAYLHDDGGATAALCDYKSGRGYYPETAMQLAAYRRATVAWLKNGTEVEMPKTDRGFVVHVRPENYPDSGFRVVPYDTSDEVYATFLACLDLTGRWTLKDENRLIGEPMNSPPRTEQQIVDTALEAAAKLREMGA